MPLDLVFPENTGRVPNSKLPLQLKHVIAVVYAFGGFAALMALLSKLIVKPLFEQLTAERQNLAQETRYSLMRLCRSMERYIKTVPSTHSIKHGYVDTKVQTYEKYRNEPSKWYASYHPFNPTELKDDYHDRETGLLDEIKSLEEYMRDVAFGYSSVSSNAKAKTSAVAGFRGEVRSFKGALLAL